ncbi:hypothetical protein AAU01_01850 [Paenarthrobacter aurescens]|uniref:Uncharacterized protein n=1 Tax=Paenarthrobacter aurescens TaxID=43663 RepID=A0A4Y3N6Q1_PAEAU|nr:hypothetical protein AAU01_01850 [Paenarthrobacter aurescens]
MRVKGAGGEVGVWDTKLVYYTYVAALLAGLRFSRSKHPQNPRRVWDGREHISSGLFKKAVAQFKKTRSEVLEAFSAQAGESISGGVWRTSGVIALKPSTGLTDGPPPLRQRSARNCSLRLPLSRTSSS